MTRVLKAFRLTLPDCSAMLIIAIIDIRHIVIQNKLPVYKILKPDTKLERKLRDSIDVYEELSQYLYASMNKRMNIS